MTIPPRVLAIMIEVSERHGMTVADLLGDGRTAKVARARHEAIRAVASLHMPSGQPTTPQIGAWFGRDHTTILNSLGRLSGRCGLARPWSAPRARTKRVAWALRAPVSSCSAKLVLVLLAEASARDGTCSLGTDDLADIIGLERRGVRYHLARLIEEGWLRRQRHPGEPSTFTLSDPRQNRPHPVIKVWSGSVTAYQNSAEGANLAA